MKNLRTQVMNIKKMGCHKRYDAPQQQECKEAQVVSGGHVDGSKRSRPDLPETISMVPAEEQESNTNQGQIA